MRFKNVLKSLLIILITIGINSCKQKIENKTESNKTQKEIGVFNFDNETNLSKNDSITFDLHNKEDLKKYRALNLDENHPNLLDPEISLGNFESVKQSWINLHKGIDTYLTANNFDWEIENSSISIFHKIYFHPDGKIKYYFFNIRNTAVTPTKRIEYAKLISDFAKANWIEFSSSHQFAQCGKTRYIN